MAKKMAKKTRIGKKEIIELLIILILIALVLAFSGVAKKDDYNQGDCKCDVENCESCCFENDYGDSDDDDDDDDEDKECVYDDDCSGSKSCNSMGKCIDRD